MPRNPAVIEVRRVDDDKSVASARALFREYAAAVARDLSLQDFGRELAELPGEYAPPRGALLLANCGGRLAGCVALRPLSDDACEMRRLFVRHQFRGKGVGKRLALAVIETARDGGYRAVRLNLAPWMEEAIVIYRTLGFRPIEPYRPDHVNGLVFMELPLH
ncbi:MAG TPA: GNAT family N-acetyltransferase [Thermoanaerobaculaceae bacterium]|nr:GNAT family N-acetyltransferase [Thermoanaerobaculaceae bacterium]